MDKENSQVNKPQKISAIANFIFMARWLQLPLYLGLILAQIIFVIHFWIELSELIAAAFGNSNALHHILNSVAVPGMDAPEKLSETIIILVVLGLIDVLAIEYHRDLSPNNSEYKLLSRIFQKFNIAEKYWAG
jgi:uncharacterized membrane protein YqhA